MRKPSNRCLPNVVSIYRFNGTRDSSGFVVGDDSAYTETIAAGVQCSVQPSDPEDVYDEQMRPTGTVATWMVLFRDNYAIKQKDKIVWVDDLGASRKLFAKGPPSNQAGRNAMWAVTTIEKL